MSVDSSTKKSTGARRHQSNQVLHRPTALVDLGAGQRGRDQWDQQGQLPMVVKLRHGEAIPVDRDGAQAFRLLDLGEHKCSGANATGTWRWSSGASYSAAFRSSMECRIAARLCEARIRPCMGSICGPRYRNGTMPPAPSELSLSTAR